jgi:hypothetical protein
MPGALQAEPQGARRGTYVILRHNRLYMKLVKKRHVDDAKHVKTSLKEQMWHLKTPCSRLDETDDISHDDHYDEVEVEKDLDGRPILFNAYEPGSEALAC